jgi:hypothetical protein
LAPHQNNLQKITRFQEILATFRNTIVSWEKKYPELREEIAELIPENSYPLENFIVYNTDLDKISGEKEIKLIVVADNPGKDEQLDKNMAYLVGKSGVVMKNFLTQNSIIELPEQQLIILNKTPVHTASTLLLKKLKKHREFIDETQAYMAHLLRDIHTLFPVPIWIIGMSEIRQKGLFAPWRSEMMNLCEKEKTLERDLLCFKHFSYGNFSKDIKQTIEENPGITVEKAITLRGRSYRSRCF